MSVVSPSPRRLATSLVVVSLLAATAFAAPAPAPRAKPAVAPWATTAPLDDEALAKKVDTLLSAQFPAFGPGAAALVVRDGKTILRKGYGLANVELSVPNSPETVFRIGSVTKQFTAVAILLLVEEGKVALADPVTKFLPDFPTGGRTVTVEHLLTHTSGIKSYTDQEQFLPEIRRDYTPKEMIDRFKGEPFEFEPGTKWNYSNSGYFLLGEIVRVASGKPWGEFLKTRIFEPAGMTSTSIDDTTSIVKNRAAGYQPASIGVANADWMSMTQPYSAGAILSTVDDLWRWNQALDAGKILKAETLARAFRPFVLADGSPTAYGYGWMIVDVPGGPSWIEHGGGINGFLSEAIRIPSKNAFVAILSNITAPPGPTDAARTTALDILGIAWAPKAIDLPAKSLARYAGVYRIDKDSTRVLTVEDGKLFAQRSGSSKIAVTPFSETDFFYPEGTTWFRIELGKKGRPTGMVMHRMASAPERAVYTDEKPPAPSKEVVVSEAKLDRLLGRYDLGRGFFIEVTREGAQLRAQATGQPRFDLFAESETLFFLKVVDAKMEFTLGADGKATSMTLHQGGAHIPGKKVVE